MTSLYALTEDFRAIMDSAFDPETGEALPEFELKRELIVHKIPQVAAYIMNTEMDEEMADIAIRRITAVKQAYARKAEHLREYLATCMKASGITEVKADDRSFTVKLFPDRDESVELDPGAVWPAELCNEPAPPKPSKTKIRAAILKGEPVAGARLVKRDRLTIR